jgi:uncharacterized membrane protein
MTFAEWLRERGFEWAQLILRWFHVAAAITWIGQTYLFNWMERHMRPPPTGAAAGPGAASAGELWMVHGGGFWRLEKLMVPEQMPQHLLWFKWEAGLTWISGMLLLVTQFYAVRGILVDPDPPVPHEAAVAIALGALVAGVIVYDALMMRTALGRNEIAAAATGVALVMAASYGLGRVLSGRAAFFHVGAMLGTIMVANVWLRIIPAQKALIAARKAGAEPDLARASRAKRSSKHNSYMSVVVILVMISNHFPAATYGNEHAWAILGGLTLAGFLAQRVFRGPAHEPR